MAVLEQLLGPACHRHLAMIEHIRPVGGLKSQVDVLLNHEYASADLVSDPADHWEHPLDDHRCEAKAHLVDHQNLGTTAKRSPDSEHLLLSAGQQSSPGRHSRLE